MRTLNCATKHTDYDLHSEFSLGSGFLSRAGLPAKTAARTLESIDCTSQSYLFKNFYII